MHLGLAQQVPGGCCLAGRRSSRRSLGRRDVECSQRPSGHSEAVEARSGPNQTVTECGTRLGAVNWYKSSNWLQNRVLNVFVCFSFGGADGVRTHDLLDAIEARSQLRHGPTERSKSTTGLGG